MLILDAVGGTQQLNGNLPTDLIELDSDELATSHDCVLKTLSSLVWSFCKKRRLI